MILFVAAEKREFDGLQRHTPVWTKLAAELEFAAESKLDGRTIWMVANGPGPRLAERALDLVLRDQPEDLEGIVSVGFCGGLDPTFQPCDIFVADEVLCREVPPSSEPLVAEPVLATGGSSAFAPALLRKSRAEVRYPAQVPRHHPPAQTGTLLSIDRVAVSAGEKSQLHRTGLAVVEMEAAAVASSAHRLRLPFFCIRVVTDAAHETFSIDFNQMRDGQGRFSRPRILAAALRNPFRSFPELLRFDARCKSAAFALGEFLANCQF